MSTLELVLLVVGDVVGGVVVAMMLDAFRREPVKKDEERRFVYRDAKPATLSVTPRADLQRELLEQAMWAQLQSQEALARQQSAAQMSSAQVPGYYMQQMQGGLQQDWLTAMMGLGGLPQPRQKLLPPGGGPQ
jgi:transposase InsO family protein